MAANRILYWEGLNAIYITLRVSDNSEETQIKAANRLSRNGL